MTDVPEVRGHGKAPVPPKSVVARALLVLGQFSVSTPSLNISEISRATGLPVATVFRFLGELEAGQFVQRSVGGRFRLGTRLWEMGLLTHLHGRLRETALPFLLNLQYKTRETVQFAIPHGDAALYIEKLTHEEAIPQQSRIGARMPWHGTGVGKAMLAFSEPAIQDEVLGRPLRPYTPHTVVDPTELRHQLRAIRARGYAMSAEEYVVGSTSIAAPVLVAGTVQAAVGIVNYRLDPHLERFTEPLLHAAEGIGKRLEDLEDLEDLGGRLA
jgi:DNA-binding IclR family transcriptional regulator